MAKQNFYTYPSMEKQLKQWTVQYSADYFRLDSIGRTPAKRHLYACHLGAADAPKQLVLTASIHGRDHDESPRHNVLLHIIHIHHC